MCIMSFKKPKPQQKPTHDEIAAQTAAFLASGGSVETVETVEDPKIAAVRFYNAYDKVIAKQLNKKGVRKTRHKIALLRSSRAIYEC